MARSMLTHMAGGRAMTEPVHHLDWHSAPLEPSTRIDRFYKNTQNVRRFFKREIGAHFKFDRSFMEWMKKHNGLTLSDAVAEWRRREAGK
jgi:hypothetical protein